MRLAVIAVVLFVVACSADSPPNMQGSFTSGVIYDEVPWNRVQGRNVTNWVGGWAFDTDRNARVIFINESTWGMRQIQDIKNHMVYEIVDDASYCKVSQMPSDWGPLLGWVKYARFVGGNVLFGEIVKSYSLVGDDATLYMHTTLGGLPFRMTIESDEDRRTQIWDWRDFKWGTPPAAWFTVPSFCKQDNKVAALSPEVASRVEALEASLVSASQPRL